MDKVEVFIVFPPPSRLVLAVASGPTIERIGESALEQFFQLLLSFDLSYNLLSLIHAYRFNWRPVSHLI
jgi:hypothetical protein